MEEQNDELRVEGVEVSDVGALRRAVRVTLSAAALAAETEARLRRLAKTAKLPGFRPGKAPAAMLKRQYGASLRAEALESLAQRRMVEALGDGRIRGSVHVYPPELQPAEGGTLELRFEVERMPEVTPTGYLGLRLEIKPVTIAEDALEKRLAGLQEEHAHMVPVEGRTTVEAGDVVTLSYRGEGSEAAEKIGQDDAQIDLADAELLRPFAEGIVGATVGEEKVFSMTFPEDFRESSLAGEPVDVRVTVHKIERKVVPDLDDAFAVDTGIASSLEELKASLQAQLDDAASAERRKRAQARALELVLDAHPVELPEGYVSAEAAREFDGLREQLKRYEMTFEQVGLDAKQQYTRIMTELQRGMRQSLVLSAIARKEGLEASDADIDAQVEREAARHNMPVAMLKARMDQETRARYAYEARMSRVLDFVVDGATIVEVADAAEPEGADSPSEG